MISLSNKLWMVCITIVCSLILVPASGFPFFGGDPGGGSATEPPHGLNISDDAKGTKLNGVIIMEFINWGDELGLGQDYADMARVVIRLSKGNDSKGINEQGNDAKGSELRTFYDEIPGPLSPSDEPSVVQERIMAQMADDIIAAFFPGETGLGVTVKMIKKFGSVVGNAFIPRDAVQPGYGTCQVVSVLTCNPDDGPLVCDPENPDLWIEILSCDGDYEFCGNGIDDDGDLKLDTDIRYLQDIDCIKVSAYSVADIEIAVKKIPDQ